MLNNKEVIKISKFLSRVLRHNPKLIGTKLDENGWADVEELISKSNKTGIRFDMATLEYVVENNNKKRFAFNDDKTRIRASQGHSIDVDLDLAAIQPPEYLYHGTVAKFLPAIKNEGMKKMNRNHVHLSKDIETATIVAKRRGKPIILIINALEMWKQGNKFYLSQNGVWLTDAVNSDYFNEIDRKLYKKK